MSKLELPTPYELPKGTSVYNPLILFTPVAVALAQNEKICNVRPEPMALGRLAAKVGEEALPLALLVRSDHPMEVSCRTEPIARGANIRPSDMLHTTERLSVIPTLGRVMDVTGGRIIDATVALRQFAPLPKEPHSERPQEDLGLTQTYLREVLGSKATRDLVSDIPFLFTAVRGEISHE